MNGSTESAPSAETASGKCNDQNNLPLIKDTYAQKSVINFNNHNGNGLNNNQDEYKMDIKLNGSNNDKNGNANEEDEDDPLTGQFIAKASQKKMKWRRKFASTNFFMVIFLLAYVLQGCYFTYFVSVITTIEKLFHIKSATIALLLNFSEVGQICTSLILTYYAGRGHRPRWIACGMFLFALAAFGSVSPHFIFKNDLYNNGITKSDIEINETSMATTMRSTFSTSDINKNDSLIDLSKLNLCLAENVILNGKNSSSCDADTNQKTNEWVRSTTLIILAVSLLGIGVGQTAIATLGIPYIDDNVQSKQSPLYMAITIGVRILGPALGYYLGSLCMRISYDLTLNKSHNHPEFIGAWYLGLFLVATSMFFASLVMFTFPKNLRNKTAKVQPAPIDIDTKDKTNKIIDEINSIESRPKLKDFAKTIKRQLKNDILMFRTASAVLHLLPITGLYVFLPKYLENQFHMPPTQANWISGTFGILVMGVGIFVTGVISVKFPLSAKKVSLWIAFTAIATAIGMFILSLLGCPMDDFRGLSEQNGGTFANSLKFTPICNATGCQCVDDRSFAPVCDKDNELNYFSACTAGCKNATKENGSFVYSDCQCGSDDFKVPKLLHEGRCKNKECDLMLYIFVGVFALTVFIHSTSEVGGMLIIMRCTHPKDKAMAMGIVQFSISLLSNIPCPHIFGRIIDATCIVWTEICGKHGHCVFFNVDSFRHLFFGVSCFTMLIAFVMDIVVYLKSHRIDIDPEGNASGEQRGDEIPQEDHGAENLLKLRKLPDVDDEQQQTKIGI